MTTPPGVGRKSWYIIIIIIIISNSRGVSLFSVVGKLDNRVLIKRVMARTECAIGEEQCLFKQGRGCMCVKSI